MLKPPWAQGGGRSNRAAPTTAKQLIYFQCSLPTRERTCSGLWVFAVLSCSEQLQIPTTVESASSRNCARNDGCIPSTHTCNALKIVKTASQKRTPRARPRKTQALPKNTTGRRVGVAARTPFYLRGRPCSSRYQPSGVVVVAPLERRCRCRELHYFACFRELRLFVCAGGV